MTITKSTKLVNLRAIPRRQIDTRPTVTTTEICQAPTRVHGLQILPVYWGPEPRPELVKVHGTSGIRRTPGVLVLAGKGQLKYHKSISRAATGYTQNNIGSIGLGVVRVIAGVCKLAHRIFTRIRF